MRLAGRWRDGFDGHYLYLLREDGDEAVRLGSTKDPTRHLEDLQRGNRRALHYVAILPGQTAHKAHVARLHEAHRVRGDWYAAPPLLDFARRAGERLNLVIAADGREAMLTVLAELDPAIADLQRMWRNGTGADGIAALTGLSRPTVEERVKHLRTMGYGLSYRRVSLRAA